MKRIMIYLLGLVASILALDPQLSTAFAQGTAFTYQGRLNVSGAPANGTYDLVFTTSDLPTGPGAFANRTNAAVAISNGLFTVIPDLDLPGIFHRAGSLAGNCRAVADSLVTMLVDIGRR